MENIHKSFLRPWISKHFNVRKVKEYWSSEMAAIIKSSEHYNCEASVELKENVTFEEFESISLNVPNGDNLLNMDSSVQIPEDMDLMTVLLQKADNEKRDQNRTYNMASYNSYRFYLYPTTKALGEKLERITSSTRSVVMPEVTMTVQFFRPMVAFSHFQSGSTKIPKYCLEHEFSVLGSQYLTELRDKVACVSDMSIPNDYSDAPMAIKPYRCKELYKSGFFYINGTFYNDMRDESNIDYSKNIVEWAQGIKGIGPFDVTKMESTMFVDLEIQIGYPYVYVHQGYCEHLFAFTDLRLLSEGDTKSLKDYPIHKQFIEKRRIFCMACHLHTAQWIVHQSTRLPENPFFFCDSCFLSFNYTKDNKKIGEFVAHCYFDRTILV